MGMFPDDALSDAFEPSYNKNLDTPVTMYSLAALWADEELHQCAKCKLTGDKGNSVFPSIVIPASDTLRQLEPVKLILLGEAPGQHESDTGFGYVGDAGSLLMEFLTQMWGTDMPTTLLGNMVLCRPQNNATPTAAVLKNCANNFWPQLLMDEDIVADRALIVVTGASPLKGIFGMAEEGIKPPNITSWHGQFRELTFSDGTADPTYRTFPVMACYHPAFALHSPDKLEAVAADYQKMYQVYNKIQRLRPGEPLVKEKSPYEADLNDKKLLKVYTDQLKLQDIDEMIATLDTIHEGMEDRTITYDVENKNLKQQDPTNFIMVAGFGAHDGHTWQFVDNSTASVRQVFNRLREEGYKLVGHNLWHDFMISWKERFFEDVDELPEHRDTRVMQKLIDENLTENGLKFLCQRYLGVDDWSEDLNQFTDADGVKDFTKIPKDSLLKYHRGDLIYNARLYYVMMEEIGKEENSGTWKIDYVWFRHKCNHELLRCSIEGMKLDYKMLGSLMEKYETDMEEIKAWFKQPLYQRVIASIGQLDKEMKATVLSTLANFPIVEEYNEKKDLFNPNSADQVLLLLSAVLDAPTKQALIKSLGRKARTAKGKVSLSEENLNTLVHMASTNPVVKNKYGYLVEGLQKVLEFRKLGKIYGTFIAGMLKHSHVDGCVRSHWNVDGAATGRLSSTNPNCQNIPRDATAKDIKRLFIPKHEGWYFMQMDLSQAELRGLGTLSGDPTLKHAYDTDLDLHTFTASQIYGVPLEEVTKIQRQAAKTANFSIGYGASAKRLADVNKLPLADAQQILDSWYETYANVKEWQQEIFRQVDEDQCVYGVWGLKRRLPHSMSREDNNADLKRVAGNCVDVETEILTLSGWKHYDEIKAGDNLLTFNMDTGSLERDTIKLVRVFDAEDDKGIPCVEFNHPSISAVSTLDHRWPIWDADKKDTVYKFVNTADIKSNGGHRLIRCAGNKFVDNPDWTDMQLALIGWLVTDSYFGKSKVTIAQSLSANPCKVQRIQEVLDALKLSYTRVDKVRQGKAKSYMVSIFYVHSCEFIQSLREDVLPNRMLTFDFIWSLSQRQAQVLVDEMLLGDGGCRDKAHDMWMFACSNKQKADLFQALCMQAGVATSVTEKQPTGRTQHSSLVQEQGVTTKNPYYIIRLLHRKHAYMYEHHRSLVYVGRVWCPTTGNGTWIARRRGTVYITGNCPIQGFASEFNLFLLIWIADELKERGLDWGVKLVNTVHDSIIYEVHPDCIRELVDVYQWAVDAGNDMCREYFPEGTYIEFEGDIELGEVWSDLKKVVLDETGELVYEDD